jgi:hypothetical protein
MEARDELTGMREGIWRLVDAYGGSNDLEEEDMGDDVDIDV